MGSETTDFARRIGRAIKVERVTRGLSRREFADLTDLSYPYLSEIENGRKFPTSATLEKIALALDLRPSALLAAAEMLVEAEWAQEEDLDESPSGVSRVEMLNAKFERSSRTPKEEYMRRRRAEVSRSSRPDPANDDPDRAARVGQLARLAEDLDQASLEQLVALARFLRQR